VAGAVSRVRT